MSLCVIISPFARKLRCEFVSMHGSELRCEIVSMHGSEPAAVMKYIFAPYNILPNCRLNVCRYGLAV
jgi:hypothetical protein